MIEYDFKTAGHPEWPKHLNVFMQFRHNKRRQTRMHTLHRECNNMRRRYVLDVVEPAWWNLIGHFTRINKLHKLDVFHRNIGMSYMLTEITTATELRRYFGHRPNEVSAGYRRLTK